MKHVTIIYKESFRGATDRRTREIIPWQEVTSKRDDKPLGNKAQQKPKTEDQSPGMNTAEDSRIDSPIKL
jgi:hypothetical protein